MKKFLLMALVLIMGATALTGCVVGSVSPSDANEPSFFAQMPTWAIFNLFVFGGFGFWIYCAIWLLILIVVCSDEDWATPVIIIAVGAFAMWLFGAFNPFVLAFNYICANPLNVIGGIFGYIVIGLIYASIKLKLMSNRLADKFGKLLDQFLIDKKIEGRQIPVKNMGDWESRCYHNRIPSKPSIDYFKERLVFWWTWWPLSFPRTLIREFVLRLFENLYEFCKGYFEKIMLSSFTKFNLQELFNKDENPKK